MRQMMGVMAIAEAQLEELKRDKTSMLIGLNTSTGGGMGGATGIVQQLGTGQTIDAPICEAGYAGFGVGMALAGVRTIVEIQFADFITYAFDAIVNQAAKMRYLTDGKVSMPIVFRACQGKGLKFGAQHSQCIESWFHNVPGLKIVMPATPYDYKGLLKTAIRDDDPVLFLESKSCIFRKGEVPEEEYTIPFGQARVAKEGTDVTIIALQSMLFPSLAVAQELESQGISVEVVDPRTIVPLDRETICNSAKKTGRVVIAHEAPVKGGVAGEIACVITENCFKDLKAPVSRVGALNIPIPFGSAEDYVLPNADSIKKAVLKLMEEK